MNHVPQINTALSISSSWRASNSKSAICVLDAGFGRCCIRGHALHWARVKFLFCLPLLVLILNSRRRRRNQFSLGLVWKTNSFLELGILAVVCSCSTAKTLAHVVASKFHQWELLLMDHKSKVSIRIDHDRLSI